MASRSWAQGWEGSDVLRRLTDLLGRRASARLQTAPASSEVGRHATLSGCPACHAVRAEHAALEERASRLALHERRLRDATAAARVCAVRWEIDSGRISWESGFSAVMGGVGLTWASALVGWDGLLNDEDAERLRVLARSACQTETFFEARFGLKGHAAVWEVRIRAMPEPEVRGQPCVASGLMGVSRVASHSAIEGASHIHGASAAARRGA